MIETQIIQIAGVPLHFVRCPAGSFYMGSDYGLSLERPGRKVSINLPFWIAMTLVTQELWVKVMSGNPSIFNGSNNLPVDGISYDRAIEFCNSAAIMTGVGLALPTEAQWEYACRAGTTSEYFWGSSPSQSGYYGWFDIAAMDKTHEVASLAANPWGLFDIVGNL